MTEAVLSAGEVMLASGEPTWKNVDFEGPLIRFSSLTSPFLSCAAFRNSESVCLSSLADAMEIIGKQAECERKKLKIGLSFVGPF